MSSGSIEIVDCHCHAGKGGGARFEGRALGAYLHRATAAGIARTVLLAPFSPDYARANRKVAALVAAGAGRFAGLAFLHAARDRGRIESLVREAVALGLCGLKVHRRDAPITDEICAAAHAFGLPILYDVRAQIEPLPALARAYPSVDFIIPHLASFDDDPAAQRGFLPLLASWPNLFTDTAGVRHFDLLREALRIAGPSKILFGSDGPWLHPGLELAKVKLLGLSAPAAAAILGGNARRLLKLVPLASGSGVAPLRAS